MGWKRLEGPGGGTGPIALPPTKVSKAGRVQKRKGEETPASFRKVERNFSDIWIVSWCKALSFHSTAAPLATLPAFTYHPQTSTSWYVSRWTSLEGSAKCTKPRYFQGNYIPFFEDQVGLFTCSPAHPDKGHKPRQSCSPPPPACPLLCFVSRAAHRAGGGGCPQSQTAAFLRLDLIWFTKSFPKMRNLRHGRPPHPVSS